MISGKNKFRLAIVRSHPTPYFTPLYQALAQSDLIEIQVYYLKTRTGLGAIDPQFGIPIHWDTDLFSDYPNTRLQNWGLGKYLPPPFNLFSWDLYSALKHGKYDGIFNAGFGELLDWEVIFIAKLLKIPLILRPEINENPSKKKTIKFFFRRQVLKKLYAQAAAFLAIGKRAEKHYLEHNGNPYKLFFSPYCVDNTFFQRSCDGLPPKTRLKIELGFDPKVITFLFCGKLSQKKHPLLLIHALQYLPDKTKLSLLFVGEGPLKTDLISGLKKTGFTTYKFAGFVNQAGLSRMYAASDFLVLPSDTGETWGLVVNEALACALPCIVSSDVGSSNDLILDGKTGFIFQSGNERDLARAIQQALDLSEKDLSKLSREAQAHVNQYSIQKARDGFENAVRHIMKCAPSSELI